MSEEKTLVEMQQHGQEHQPLVSIITTSYNSDRTIGDTLLSVANQNYPFIEHIIVDGASSDQTLQIIKSFPHVKTFISEKDKGIYDGMNKGLQLAKGDIIGLLNSDDFYINSQVISDVVQRMQENHTDALYADLIYVHPDQTDRIMRTWVAGNYNRKKFLFGWMPPHPTFFVRRHVYESHGSFTTALRSAADYELMLRFLYKHKVSVCYFPKVIIKMRAGGMSNASLYNRIKANKEDRQSWQMNNLSPYFFTSWLKPIRKITQFLNEKKHVL